MLSDEEAKTAGKVVDLATKVGGFVARYTGGPLEQGVGIFEDRIKYSRWERQVRLMKRSEDLLKEVGLQNPSRVIPLKFAVPLLQAATLEDNDELQDRWAALLVNAGNKDSGIEINRAYISVLEQITPLEAQILDKIYSLRFEIPRDSVLTYKLPGEALKWLKPTEPLNDIYDFTPTLDVQLALANLDRLGCITPANIFADSPPFCFVRQTFFGKKFVDACTLQKQ